MTAGASCCAQVRARHDGGMSAKPALVVPAGEKCKQCGHDFDPHAMVGAGDDILDGGYVLCLTLDCVCTSVWSVPGHEAPPSLDPDDADDIRRELRRGPQ